MTIAAIVLAGGMSRRFGTANKLLADIDGQPLLRRVVDRIGHTSAGHVAVVTGHDAHAIAMAIAGSRAVIVANPRYLVGMGTTVAAGIAALPPIVQGALVTPGDMPDITTAFAQQLIARFNDAGREKIVFAASPGGEPRSPVIWPRRFFGELISLDGDVGGRHLVQRHFDDAIAVPAPSQTTIFDIDRPEDLERWRKEQA